MIPPGTYVITGTLQSASSAFNAAGRFSDERPLTVTCGTCTADPPPNNARPPRMVVEVPQIKVSATHGWCLTHCERVGGLALRRFGQSVD